MNLPMFANSINTSVTRGIISKVVYRVFSSKATTMESRVTRKSLRDDEHRERVDKVKTQFLEMTLESKRKLYKCKEKFKELSSIPTWPEYFHEHIKEDAKHLDWWKRNKKKVETGISEELNAKISIFTGDITSLEIDSIANAANESLLGGGGVDGAIHAAAGNQLRAECELLNGCSPGDAKLTLGYKLPAKYVLHTVGPRGEKSEVLKNCYKNCLQLMKDNQLRSVAFPCISTGIFGYPNLNAAKVALGTIREWLEEEEYSKNIDRVILCLFLPKDVGIYQEQLQMFFPIDRSEVTPEKKAAESSSEVEDKAEKSDEQSNTEKKEKEDNLKDCNTLKKTEDPS